MKKQTKNREPAAIKESPEIRSSGNSKVLAIIPAREGSKGIKDKNVTPFNGKSLIAWTIEAARKAGEIDRLIVSTDSQRYKDILEHDYGADLFPFLRPESLAQDDSSSIDVILYTLDRLEKSGEIYDIVVLLEPTSPMRTPEQINEAIQLLKQAPRARALVSVSEAHKHHPSNAMEENRGGFLVPYGSGTGLSAAEPDYPRHVGRQAYRPALFPSGDLYLSYVDTFRERRTFYHDLAVKYKIPSWQDPEVDEPHDLIMIDALMKARQGGKI